MAAAFCSLFATVDAACVDQDAGDPFWDGVCSFISEQPSPTDECTILIGGGMSAGLCCACTATGGEVTLSELQIMLPALCKVCTEKSQVSSLSAYYYCSDGAAPPLTKSLETASNLSLS